MKSANIASAVPNFTKMLPIKNRNLPMGNLLKIGCVLPLP